MKYLCSVILLVCLGSSQARPDGAPAAACQSMMPQSPHPSDGLQTQRSSYNISLANFSKNDNGDFEYVPGQMYTISYFPTGNATYRGFFIQGRLVADNSTVGTFMNPTNNANARLSFCSPPTVGVTHVNNLDSNARIDFNGSMNFTWTAPAAGTGPIWFRFSTVQTLSVFWVGETTEMIVERAGAQLLSGVGFISSMVIALCTMIKILM